MCDSHTDPHSVLLIGPCLQEEEEVAEKMRKVKIIHLSGSGSLFVR